MQMTSRSEAPAANDGATRLNYTELDRLSNRFARLFISANTAPGDLVAVSMNRSVEMLAALLGIWKAGAAYLPLDPAYPEAHTRRILEDARPVTVIADRGLAVPGFRALSARDLPNIDEPVPENIHPSSLAYVIYTSGSSGLPKGVQVEHGALLNVLDAMADRLEISARDRVLASSTICFDMACLELFIPLIRGASVSIVSRDVARNPERLAEAIDEFGITVMLATPSSWRMLLESGWQGRPELKMISGGEPLTLGLRDELLQRGAELWNAYGPTEATIGATLRRMSPFDASISIGRPLRNYTLHVVDDHLHELPPGEIGELCIGGLGVARGYLNRPELTASRFVPNPFSNDPTARLYRTGDLARQNDDGEFELLGRADYQVKIRGFRVEPGEIEVALERHPAVRRCVVTTSAGTGGDLRLLAYWVPGGEATEPQLREHLRGLLPPHMIPSCFIPMDQLPLAPSGKVDRHALPMPRLEMSPPRTVAAGPLEAALLTIWQELLGRRDIGLDDNFFDLGGHSLTVARMISRITRDLHYALPSGVVVECPTIAALAACLQQRTRERSSLVALQTDGTLAPLYIVHHGEGDVILYRSLAARFAPRRPVYGFEAPAGFMDRKELHTIESLAAHYVEDLLTHRPHGPYHLSGHSTGGLIAVEMARELRRRGHRVGLVALIDSDLPGGQSDLHPLQRHWYLTGQKVRRIVYKASYECQRGPREFVTRRWRFATKGFRLWRLRARQQTLGHVTGSTTEEILMLMEQRYRPEPFPTPVTLLRSRDEAWKYGPDPNMGWTGILQLDIHDIGGNHVSMLYPPHVDHVARVLADRAAATERRESEVI